MIFGFIQAKKTLLYVEKLQTGHIQPRKEMQAFQLRRMKVSVIKHGRRKENKTITQLQGTRDIVTSRTSKKG